MKNKQNNFTKQFAQLLLGGLLMTGFFATGQRIKKLTPIDFEPIDPELILPVSLSPSVGGIKTLGFLNPVVTTCIVGGITITATGTSSSTYDTPSAITNTCAGLTPFTGFTPWTDTNTTGFITYTFSQPVSSATISYTSVNGPNDDIGTMSINNTCPLQLSNLCGIAATGNSVRCTYNGYGGVRMTVSSTTPFTSITVTNTSGTSGWVAGNLCDFALTPYVCNVTATPTLSATTIIIPCGSTTALNTIMASNMPASAPPCTIYSLTWHTASPATIANTVANVNMAGAGTYYASFYDSVSGCYSPTTPITVTAQNATFKPLSTHDSTVIVCKTSSLGGTSANSILDDDSVGSALANIYNVSINTNSLPAGISVNPNGTINVAPSVADGSYYFNYSICQKCLPTNCSQTIRTFVKVVSTNTLSAFNDFLIANQSGVFGAGGTTTDNILSNDTDGCNTFLNPSLVNITVDQYPSPYFSINTTNGSPQFGKVTLNLGTPLGQYVTGYTISKISNPSIWSRASVIVNVVSTLRQSNLKINNLIETVSVYPNPSSDIFNIKINNDINMLDNTEVDVCNVLGQIILKNNIINNQSQIDLSNFENGIYFVKLPFNEETITKMIIKK